MKIVVVRCGNFERCEEIQNLFTEFRVAEYSAYSAGILGIEDDNSVVLLLVVRSVMSNAVAEVGVEP